MKIRTISFSLLVIFNSVVHLHSQAPLPSNDTSNQRSEAERRSEEERRLRMRNMREFDTTMKPLMRPQTSVPVSPTIDKETGERIRLARRIDAADLVRYGEFLKTDNTGLFKLFPDHDCVTTNVVRADGDCKDFVMASSSFSFRTGSYVHPYYHDLRFNHGEIFSNGFFSQGILVSLGDVRIEDISPSSEGLKFIFDFQTASDLGGARSSADRLKAGFVSGGFTYSSTARPVVHTTYALRSIAYDVANSLPPISDATSIDELRFHTLALDKRADVMIVFRIVRMGGDGSLTIVWKELARKEAPKVKFAKREKFADFKPDIARAQQ